jgi:hypothetical protein
MKKDVTGENLDKITKFNTKKYDIKEDNSKKINVFLPVRNRDNFRILKCIQHIKKNNLGLVDKIIIVDNSDVSIKPIKGTIIERIETSSWNKGYLFNKAIKKYPNDFIMTVDVDIMVSEQHFEQIREHLTKNSFICATNVRRLKRKDYSSEYDDMIYNSYPWERQDMSQYHNLANGGMQIYSYDFWMDINGYHEGLGVYWGAEDNWTYFQAKLRSMSIIDVSTPLIHIEHKRQGTDMSDEERKLSREYQGYKVGFLNNVCKKIISKNSGTIAGDYPNIDLFLEFKQIYANTNEIIQKAVDDGKKEVVIGFNNFQIQKAKPTILLAVINNYGLIPDYFMYNMIEILQVCAKHGYDVALQKVSACDVNSMRNMAVKTAIGMNREKKTYDYIIMLDDDHYYYPEFVIKFVELAEQNNWDIVTGLTNRKVKPYRTTQYYKIQEDMNAPENTVKPNRSKKIIDIEASGPVGMLIKTSVFKKIPYPWYCMEFGKKKVKIIKQVNEKGKLVNKEEEVEMDSELGGDLSFSKKLKQYGYRIKLDMSVSFPHEIKMFVNRGKLLPADGKSNQLNEPQKRVRK